ncbi:DUF6461 domain-containing protein [Streptomyces sp. NPDC059991]|uniref:DUF6461 domain-containing protein n=1 Tax=unclassified Streptomyces TaxID=2593676 RepID=UPI0036CE0EEE
MSTEEARELIESSQTQGIALLGQSSGWAFAVEYGDAVASAPQGMERLSAGGAEAVSFHLMPWEPPSIFTYYKDGVKVCQFGLGEESRRWGDDPDLLVDRLSAAGVLHSEGRTHSLGADQRAEISLQVITDFFELGLRNGQLEEGRLSSVDYRR